jgi:hypothetical protein
MDDACAGGRVADPDGRDWLEATDVDAVVFDLLGVGAAVRRELGIPCFFIRSFCESSQSVAMICTPQVRRFRMGVVCGVGGSR